MLIVFKKLLSPFIIALLLQGCAGTGTKRDVINEVISQQKLKEDIYLLKRIVQTAHAGAYIYNTPVQINFLFDSISNSITSAGTTRDFYNKVNCALDRLRCIHTKTILPDEYYDSLSKTKMFFPVPLIVVREKIYVNTKSYTIPLGSEVLAINNIEAAGIIKNLGEYRHTDGYSEPIRNSSIDDDFAFNFYMRFGAFEKFLFKYTNAETGKTELTNVDAEKLKTVNDNSYNDTWYFFAGDAPYDFEILDGRNTAVLTIRSFDFSTYATKSAFTHFLDNTFRLVKQNNIDNLIIDIRNNGGGFYSNTYQLVSYLLDKPIYEYDSSIRRFDHLPYADYVAAEDTANLLDEDTTRNLFKQVRPGIYSQDKEQISLWEPNNFVFKGKTFLITNPYVISAAATFAAILKSQTSAYIVGEETGGGYAAHNACIFTYELPNSHFKISIPTRRFYQPVAYDKNQSGVMPNKYIPPSLQDVIDNIDPSLTYILDSLIKK